MSLLEVQGLNSYYGDSHILFDVSLRVEANEVVALLGRNGAGKSTTLKSLMGVVTPQSGSIVFAGAQSAGKKSHAIAQAGMQQRRCRDSRRLQGFDAAPVAIGIALRALSHEQLGVHGLFPPVPAQHDTLAGHDAHDLFTVEPAAVVKHEFACACAQVRQVFETRRHGHEVTASGEMPE